jgi:hypothetical protein
VVPARLVLVCGIRARGREQAWGSRAIERDELDEWFELFEVPDAEELGGYDPPSDDFATARPSDRA